MPEITSPEEILAVAERAQKKVEEEEEKELQGTLLTRERKIATERQAAEKSAKAKDTLLKVSDKISDINFRGGKVASELLDAEQTLMESKTATDALTEQTFEEIKAIEARPDVIGRLHDDAKKENQKYDDKKTKDKQYSKETKELRETILGARESKARYQEIIRNMDSATRAYDKLNDDYGRIQDKGKTQLATISNQSIAKLSNPNWIKLNNLGVDTNRLLHATQSDVWYPNLKQRLDEINAAIQKASLLDLSIKGELKTVKNWIEAYLPEEKKRHDVFDQKTNQYKDMVAKAKTQMRLIEQAVIDSKISSNIWSHPELAEEFKQDGLDQWIQNEVGY